MYPSSHVTRLLMCISVYSLSGFIPSQVILSTNIAESSITVPDIRYGKLLYGLNSDAYPPSAFALMLNNSRECLNL